MTVYKESISACIGQKAEIAKVVLMPGDPLRAKKVADTYLSDVVCFNDVRNMLGYTGTYKGKKISVMGHGMGIPSVGLYTHELFTQFGVESIIRIGSAGALAMDVNTSDIVIAEACTTNSNYGNQYGIGQFAPCADFNLLETAVNKARAKGCNFKVGKIFSSDFFYNPKAGEINEKLRDYGHLAIEMESAGLYWEAAVNRKRALTILSISDHLFKKQALTSEQIRDSFTDMMEIALDTAWEFAE